MLANHRSTIEIPSRFHRLWLPIENTYTAEKCGSKPWLERWNNYTACCYYQHFCPLFFTSSFFFFPPPPIYCNITRTIWVYRGTFFFFFYVSQYTPSRTRSLFVLQFASRDIDKKKRRQEGWQLDIFIIINSNNELWRGEKKDAQIVRYFLSVSWEKKKVRLKI